MFPRTIHEQFESTFAKHRLKQAIQLPGQSQCTLRLVNPRKVQQWQPCLGLLSDMRHKTVATPVVTKAIFRNCAKSEVPSKVSFTTALGALTSADTRRSYIGLQAPPAAHTAALAAHSFRGRRERFAAPTETSADLDDPLLLERRPISEEERT